MTDGKHLTGHKQSLGWHFADTADSEIYRSLDGAYREHKVMLLTIDRSRSLPTAECCVAGEYVLLWIVG